MSFDFKNGTGPKLNQKRWFRGLVQEGGGREVMRERRERGREGERGRREGVRNREVGREVHVFVCGIVISPDSAELTGKGM